MKQSFTVNGAVIKTTYDLFQIAEKDTEGFAAALPPDLGALAQLGVACGPAKTVQKAKKSISQGKKRKKAPSSKNDGADAIEKRKVPRTGRTIDKVNA